MCKCTPELRTPFCDKVGCEDEYFGIKRGPIKSYIHKKQYIITENGDILLLRSSYDKEKCFIRSICFVDPCVNFDGSNGRKYIPLNIELVGGLDKYEQLLGMKEIDELHKS